MADVMLNPIALKVPLVMSAFDIVCVKLMMLIRLTWPFVLRTCHPVWLPALLTWISRFT